MKTQADETSFVPLVIGGIAAILLGASGLAAVLAWESGSTDRDDVVLVLDRLPASQAWPVGARAQARPAQPEGDARIALDCAECGIVRSVREIEAPGDGTYPGAAAGVTQGGRNAVSGTSRKRYEVTVRMADGSNRVLRDETLAHWRPGERMIVIDGARPSRD